MRIFSVMAVILVLAVAAFAAPVHEAARVGDVAKLGAILQADPKLIDVVDPVDNLTPLALAINGDKLEAVKLLLAQGANPNFELSDRDMGMGKITPFFLALKHGNVDIIRIMLDMGADVNKKYSQTQFTALHLLLMEGNSTEAVIDLLLQHGADVKAKMVFTPEEVMNLPDEVKKLVDLPSFGTPIMFTATTSHSKERLLLKYGSVPLDAEIRRYFENERTRKQRNFCIDTLGSLMDSEIEYLVMHNQMYPWATDWKKTVAAEKTNCGQGGYGFNVYLSGMKKEWIANPGNVIVFADCKNPDGLIRSWDDIDSTRHGDGFCAVFLDGHMSFVKADTLEMIWP